MRPGVKTEFAKSLRRNMTDAEKKLWYYLRAGRLGGHKFKRQAPIGAYVVDFVAPALKLIVELDGSQHAQQQKYDAARTRFLNGCGYRVLRFGDDEALRWSKRFWARALTSPQPLRHRFHERASACVLTMP